MWLLSVLIVLAAAESSAGADVIRHELYGEVGKSMAIPMVDFESDGWWELKKPNSDPDWVVSYHGGYTFQFLYESRGRIIKKNRTVLLKNLTKSDSWEYEQWANGKLQSKINIQVLDPLYPPVLWSKGPSPEACLVLLVCEGSGGSAETLVLMKDGDEVKGNVTVMGNISLLTVNAGDPLYWGQYTCEQRNPMSSKASKSIMVESPVSLRETMCFVIIIAGLAFSFYVIAFGLFLIKVVPRHKERIKASAIIKGLAVVVFIVNIVSPMAATVVSFYGHYLISFIQVSFIVLSVAFSVIRICLCIISYSLTGQYCSKLSNHSVIKWIMGFADYFFIPGFFLYEAILFSRNYPHSCGNTWLLMLLYTLPWFIPCVLMTFAVSVYWTNPTEQDQEQSLSGDHKGGMDTGMDTGMEGKDSCKSDSCIIGVAGEGGLATG